MVLWLRIPLYVLPLLCDMVCRMVCVCVCVAYPYRLPSGTVEFEFRGEGSNRTPSVVCRLRRSAVGIGKANHSSGGDRGNPEHLVRGEGANRVAKLATVTGQHDAAVVVVEERSHIVFNLHAISLPQRVGH